MKCLHASLMLLALGVAAVFTPKAPARDVIEIDPDRYAAVAFSPSTGKYGYGWNCGSLGQAERIALSYCQEPDAKVISWVRFGWSVLVISEDDAYGHATSYGDGASSRIALDRATAQMRKHSDKPIKTILIVCSGNVQPKIITAK
jgi:hypothetical protein